MLGAFRYRVKRHGGPPDEGSCNEMVELGSVRPGESLDVDVWTTPQLGDGPRVRLTQKTGRTKIEEYEFVSQSWLRRNRRLVDGLIWLGLFTAVVAVAIVLNVVLRRSP